MTKSLILSFLLLLFLPTLAQEQPDTAFQHLRERYLKLYNEPNREAEFFEVSEKMKAYYQEQGNLDSYYKVRINEALYDSERGYNYRAIKKANSTLEDMKKDGIKQYQVVYTVLGSIFDSRGNYRMADKYYREALDNANLKDTGSVISIYSRLADLKSTREPKEAWKWNELFGSMVRNNASFYNVYLILKGQICFFMEDKRKFATAYKELLDHRRKYPEVNDYGLKSMELMHEVFEGNLDNVLAIIRSDTLQPDNLNQLDIRIKAYQILGLEKLAMREVEKRRDLRDSLNSDMLFNNINEINAELGIAKLNEQASKEREMWLAAVIVLLLTGLGLLIWRHLTRRAYQKRLQKKNQELEIALDHAKESDRMKTLFIEHVSHEIRTPLNIITGFAQVITNSSYEVDEASRNRMISDISKNTNQITEIVNELLELADGESKEYYDKNDIVDVNLTCQQLMSNLEKENNGRLTLSFKSLLNKRHTIKTNQQVLEKILIQLLNNALKFTEEGSVELSVRERAGNGGTEFSVTDTGRGISKENQDKVFERFYKEDSFKQGFGLGLTLCLKSARLLGGTLELDKKYDKGARFVLTLPSV